MVNGVYVEWDLQRIERNKKAASIGDFIVALEHCCFVRYVLSVELDVFGPVTACLLFKGFLARFVVIYWN